MQFLSKDIQVQKGYENMLFCYMTIDEILSRKAHIICFGSGKAFDKFVELFEGIEIAKSIKYIVDNDESKQGTVKQCGEYSIKIVSPQVFVNDSLEENTIGIIALKDKEFILQQYTNIESVSLLKTVWYFDIMRDYCTRMFDLAEPVQELRRSNTMIIPKKIHYCWFGGGKIPDDNLRWMESWAKYCPDYEIIQWNEKNYDITKNLYMKQAYETKNYAYASDYARLDILYHEGGVYLDTDVELIKNLDEMLYQPAFFGWEDGLRVATGLGFGAINNFELLKEMRDYYDTITFIKDNGKLDLTACPTFQTRVLQRYGLKKDGSYQIIKDASILPVTYLCGKPSYLSKSTRSQYTYAIHQFQSSGRGV